MKELVVLLLIALGNWVLVQSSRVDIPEDATMTFYDLAKKYSQNAEQYDLKVEDGYILKLFRIPGDKSKPVLFVHGAVDSSDSFIVRGNTSIAIGLSRENYDVWAINLRGNTYSRRHESMDPDTDKKYWNFSVHEFGYIDLPTAIDFILNVTRQNKLSVIGYSEGTTSTYILGATRPEYNDKIKISISMAPICYLHNTRLYVSLLMDLAPAFNEILIALGQEEILGFNTSLKAFIDSFCLQKHTGYLICLKGLFSIVGSDAKEIEESFLPVILGHFPAGTSRKNLLHLTQIRAKKRFVKFDYGSARNMIVYNRLSPPEYDLSKVTMKMALIAAKNDRLSTIEDVNLLSKRLPNVVKYKILEEDAFNHVDYVWGRTAHNTLIPYILKLLKTYG